MMASLALMTSKVTHMNSRNLSHSIFKSQEFSQYIYANSSTVVLLSRSRQHIRFLLVASNPFCLLQNNTPLLSLNCFVLGVCRHQKQYSFENMFQVH